MDFPEYPKWLYHETRGASRVENAADHEALNVNGDWFEHPALVKEGPRGEWPPKPSSAEATYQPVLFPKIVYSADGTERRRVESLQELAGLTGLWYEDPLGRVLANGLRRDASNVPSVEPAEKRKRERKNEQGS